MGVWVWDRTSVKAGSREESRSRSRSRAALPPADGILHLPPPAAATLNRAAERHVADCLQSSWTNLVDSGKLISPSNVQEGFLIRQSTGGLLWSQRPVLTCNRRVQTRLEPVLFQSVLEVLRLALKHQNAVTTPERSHKPSGFESDCLTMQPGIGEIGRGPFLGTPRDKKGQVVDEREPAPVQRCILGKFLHTHWNQL